MVCLTRSSLYSVCSTLLYASEADYNDLNVEQESEPESRSFADICTELLDEIRKLVTSQTTKIDADPESKVVNEPDLESEVKYPLIETRVDLLAEPAMKLFS